MNVSSLEVLEKSQLPPAQARAILQVMDDELTARDRSLATKSDIREMRLDLDVKLEGFKTEIIRWNFAFWIAQLAAFVGVLKLIK